MRFRRIDRCLSIYRAARVTIGDSTAPPTSRPSSSTRARTSTSADRRTPGFAERAPTQGYSALTIADSLRLTFPRIEIDDAAVHGVYLAGGGGAEGSRHVRFGHVPPAARASAASSARHR